MQAFAPLYSVLSLCNFGLSHVGHQTTKKLFFFFSPNFVYSVIINQSRGMTRLLGSDRQKEYVERLTWKKKEKRKTGKEKGGWKKGSLKNSKFFKLPRQCQNELGVCLAWECVYGSARVRVHGSLFMSLCVWLTTLLQECTMTEWELAAGPIPLRIHRKNPLQLTSRLWQTHTYYALKLRRAGEHMAASLIPLRQCAFVSVCVCVWSLQR